MPGPHDFTVRENCARRNATPRPPHPALNVRDDAYAPLIERGCEEENTMFGKREARYFRRGGLTTQISLDLLAKLVFRRERFRCDRVVLKVSSMPNRRTMQVIWPTARLYFADILASQILARMCHQKFIYWVRSAGAALRFETDIRAALCHGRLGPRAAIYYCRSSRTSIGDAARIAPTTRPTKPSAVAPTGP
jgi:hypothetical protein